MASKLFLEILNMSFTGTIVIFIVLIARILLKKAPQSFSYTLWTVVLYRLISPFQIESNLSFLAIKTKLILQDIVYAIPAMNLIVNSSMPASFQYTSSNPIQGWLWIGTFIWIVGIVVMLGYSVFTLNRLKQRLKRAVHESDHVYLVEQLGTPFVLGVWCPSIYLPTTLKETEKTYIVLHERCHIQRFDHVMKVIAYLVLCLHWFNPFVWIAFFLSGNDMEMSCDEMVVRKLGENVKRDYSSSLQSFATGKRFVVGFPLAFGEGDTKKRVKHVLGYKKPSFWLMMLAVVIVFSVVVGLMTSQKRNDNDLTVVNAVIIEIDRDNLTMLVEGIDENNVIGEACVITWEGEPFITEGSNGESMPLSLDDFSVDDHIVLTIGEVQESYPTKAVATMIQLRTNNLVMKTYPYDELWNARTLYVGDNSKVSKLIGLLPIANGLQYDHIVLHTQTQPYVVDIVYRASTTVLDEYETDKKIIGNFYDNALVLLALIDNADGIRIRLTDGTQEKEVMIGREWSQLALGRDVREYGQSPEMLHELLESFLRVTQQVTDFSTYPRRYSSQQGEEDGFFVVIHGVIRGQTQRLMDNIIRSLEARNAAKVNILQYTIEGDPIFASMSYQGGDIPIVLSLDVTRDRFGDQNVSVVQMKYVKRLFHKDYVLVVLTDQGALTVEEVLTGSTKAIVVASYKEEE